MYSADANWCNIHIFRSKIDVHANLVLAIFVFNAFLEDRVAPITSIGNLYTDTTDDPMD